jgi:DNA-binding LytR/AlgR family response regulator
MLRNRISSRPEKNHTIFVKDRHEKIHFSDVLFVEGMENYVVIHTAAAKFMTLLRMKTIEETLPGIRFYTHP